MDCKGLTNMGFIFMVVGVLALFWVAEIGIAALVVGFILAVAGRMGEK